MQSRKKFRDLLTLGTRALLISLCFLIGATVYYAGYGLLRYNDQNSDVFFTWKYWRYYLMAILHPMLLCATWWFTYILSKQSGSTTGTMYTLFALAGLGYSLVFCVWELVILLDCNDTKIVGLETVPVHPHCFNRNAPADTYPDPGFLMTFIGGIFLGIFAAICTWFGLTSRLFLQSSQFRDRERGYEVMRREDPSSNVDNLAGGFAT